MVRDLVGASLLSGAETLREFSVFSATTYSIEMLLSDSVDAAAKARNQGVKVRLSVYEGMFHVFQMGYLNFPESKRAWAEVKRFLKVIKEEE